VLARSSSNLPDPTTTLWTIVILGSRAHGTYAMFLCLVTLMESFSASQSPVGPHYIAFIWTAWKTPLPTVALAVDVSSGSAIPALKCHVTLFLP
jgi:hypothetical protein